MNVSDHGSVRTKAAPGLRYGLHVFAMVAIVSITLNLVIMPFALVTSEISEAYAINDVEFSLLIGVFFAVPVTLMSVAGGWLSDRHSRRNLLIAAIIAWTAGGIWTALAPTYEQMALARMLVAAAVGVKFPLTMTWINDAFPARHRAKAIGATFVVLNVGPASSAAIAGMFIQSAEANVFDQLPFLGGLEPWRAGLLMLSLLALLPLPFFAGLKDAERAQAEAPAADGTGTGRTYPVWIIGGLILSAALLGMADTATLGWLPAVLRRQYEYTAEQAGFAFALIVMIAGTGGPVIAGILNDRLHQRYGLIASLVVCGLACSLCIPLIAAFAQPSATVLVVALIFSGVISVMAMTIAFITIQALLSARTRGTGIGITNALESLSRAGAPTVVATTALLFTQAPADGLGIAVAVVCIGTYLIAALLYGSIAVWVARSKGGKTEASAPDIGVRSPAP